VQRVRALEQLPILGESSRQLLETGTNMLKALSLSTVVFASAPAACLGDGDGEPSRLLT